MSLLDLIGFLNKKGTRSHACVSAPDTCTDTRCAPGLLRGVVSMEVEVQTANADMHSGMFGGSIPNAAVVLARLVGQLHVEETGVVAVPGFYKVLVLLVELL